MKFWWAISFSVMLAGRAAAQPQGGEDVQFPSAQPDGTSITLAGKLYRPPGTPKGGVVLVHGSGGWSEHREGHYGKAFREAGYAVLAIDSFGPRGVSDTTEDQGRVTGSQMTADAFAARRHLLSLGLAPQRLGVMGFSKGGQVALMAADRTFLPSESDRFAVSIPFYPGCNGRPREPKPASEIFMALGERDDWTGVKPCQDLADDFRKAGGKISVVVYPGATHCFDCNPRLTTAFRLPTVENYSDCVIEIEPDGTSVYGGKRFQPGDLAILTELRKSCMKKGTTMWTNPTQKKRATEHVIEFLDRTLVN